ncbi:MAG: hypothetical protein H7123_03385 [Thermoleophilia bacterium]|nr:hypothetical protein [Thermoleophilia bacterium]
MSVRETQLGILDAVGNAITAPFGAVAKAAPDVTDAVGDAAVATGKFTWKHKGEIGLAVGTAALLASIPMTGGASGAIVGGIASRRLALGAAKMGIMALKSQKPLAAVGTALAGAALVNDGIKFARGDGPLWKVGLDTLGLIPGVGMLTKAVAARRALATEVSSAKTVAKVLPGVKNEAEAALAKVDDVSPTTGGAFGGVVEAADDAVGQASRTLSSSNVVAKISDLKSQVDAVARSATIARNETAAAGQLNASVARSLDKVAARAEGVSEKLAVNAEKHAQLIRTMNHAARVETNVGRVATTSGLATNSAGVVNAVRGQQKTGDLSGVNLAKSIVGIFLARNASKATAAAG